MDNPEEHIKKLIEIKIPAHLQITFDQVIAGMKWGFYQGIKYQKELDKEKIV